MVLEEPVVSAARLLAARPPLPREHGAWGILLIPLATAVGVTGVLDVKVALLAGSVVSFYLARASWLKRDYRWMAILLAGSVACAAPLLVVWSLWWLVALGAVALPVAFRKTERSVAMQWLAVAGLTLTAPAAWYVASGHLDTQALRLWLLNGLYFGGGVLYVKMHVAAAVARRATGRWPVVVYHGLLAGVAAVWWPVGLALAPAIVRAVAGVVLLRPRLQIRRLGWTEVGHSIVFGALVIWLAR